MLMGFEECSRYADVRKGTVVFNSFTGSISKPRGQLAIAHVTPMISLYLNVHVET